MYIIRRDVFDRDVDSSTIRAIFLPFFINNWQIKFLILSEMQFTISVHVVRPCNIHPK